MIKYYDYRLQQVLQSQWYRIAEFISCETVFTILDLPYGRQEPVYKKSTHWNPIWAKVIYIYLFTSSFELRHSVLLIFVTSPSQATEMSFQMFIEACNNN